MTPETTAWDEDRKKLGTHGTAGAGAAYGTKHERSHLALFLARPEVHEPGYVRHTGRTIQRKRGSG